MALGPEKRAARIARTHKTCLKCGETKAIGLFYKDKYKLDLHAAHCMVCAKKRANETGAKIRARAYARRQREIFADKVIARGVVRRALVSGRIERGPCFFCGSTKTQAHHPLYRYPLRILWVCREHHDQIHES